MLRPSAASAKIRNGIRIAENTYGVATAARRRTRRRAISAIGDTVLPDRKIWLSVGSLVLNGRLPRVET
jgi:hypothetical protein